MAESINPLRHLEDELRRITDEHPTLLDVQCYAQIPIEVLASTLETLDLCSDFFEHRDQMNAAVHAADIRRSPITEAVAEAHAKLGEYL